MYRKDASTNAALGGGVGVSGSNIRTISSFSVCLPNISHSKASIGLPKYWELERRTVEKAAAPAKKLSPPVLLLAVMGLAGVVPWAVRLSQAPWLCCAEVGSAWLWDCWSGSGPWCWYSLWQCKPAPGGAQPACVTHSYALMSFVASGQSRRTSLWVPVEGHRAHNGPIGSTRYASIPAAFINTQCYSLGLCRARFSPGSVQRLAKRALTSCPVMACYPMQSRTSLPTLPACALSGL